MGADLLVFPDVVVLFGRCGHEWPKILLLLFAHVEEAGPHRREQPFVKARAIVVAFEIVPLEWEMRERARAVDEHLDPQWPRHLHYLSHRHYLTGEIGDVCHF